MKSNSVVSLGILLFSFCCRVFWETNVLSLVLEYICYSVTLVAVLFVLYSDLFVLSAEEEEKLTHISLEDEQVSKFRVLWLMFLGLVIILHEWIWRQSFFTGFGPWILPPLGSS